MTPRSPDPLASAREAALRLLARLVLWLWLPVFLGGVAIRWADPAFRGMGLLTVAASPIIGWSLTRSRWPAERRARYAIAVITLVSVMAIIVNTPRALSTMGMVVALTLASLFYDRRVPTALLGGYLLAILANLVLTVNGWVTPMAPDHVQPLPYRITTLLVMLSGLWFSARVLQQTLQIYRDAQAAAELGVQAMLDAQREVEALQRRELVSVATTGMAHDLANVVQVMTATAEMLEETPLDPDGRAAVRDLRRVGEDARMRLRTILSVGRPPETEVATVRPSELFVRLDLVLRPLLGRRIAFELHNEAVQPLAIDRGRLEQVLINLALNARDAMPAGGTFRVHAMPHDGGVRFDVSDTGSGIADDVLARMWEPFYSTKDPGRGTGLGLAMVRRILERERGRVNVRTTVGQGTTFSVWVPVAPA